VTALSHEMSETFTDPFVVCDGIHGRAPWWLSPNGNCQDNMEVGDVIENLPGGVYPVTQNGFTTRKTRRWRSGSTRVSLRMRSVKPSATPNESVLTSPATFQNVKCAP